MMKEKKIAAAISAVMAYIHSAEGVVAAEPEMEKPAEAAGDLGNWNLWRIAGRQAQMQMRNLMQMKAFHGKQLR